MGQYQDAALTATCFRESFTQLKVEHARRRSGDSMILWPYPQGTADGIDRANCADDFVQRAPGYRVVTELSLSDPGWSSLEQAAGDLLVFAPFETLLTGLEVSASRDLTFRGRRCDAVMSEMIIGYLKRRGLIEATEQVSRPILRTHVVNGSSAALLKGQQMRLFERYCAQASGLSAVPYRIADDEKQLSAALAALPNDGRGLVVRPFSASQGTGVVFVDRSKLADIGADDMAQRVRHDMSTALQIKYGGDVPFPMAVSIFEESVLVEGCVTDLRIFVVFDPEHGGIRSIPGMVRRSQVPLSHHVTLDAASGMTNLNAPIAADATPGSRIFPLSAPGTLSALGLSANDLIELCNHAAAMWSAAFHDEDLYFADHSARQFCYGSVDFLIRGSDRLAVPIEMNGANVGSHPTVHPAFGDAFGAATTGALTNLGLVR